MNRLVLIGNGFDLAHGLKTSYADFINWYWDRRMIRFNNDHTDVSDDSLCRFKIRNDKIREHETWSTIAYRYNYFNSNPSLGVEYIGKDVIASIIADTDHFETKYSTFFGRIIKSIETKGWVDVENEYYELLKLTTLPHPGVFVSVDLTLTELNRQLHFLQELLVEYLTEISKQETETYRHIKHIIYAPINTKDIAVEGKKRWFDYVNSEMDKDERLLDYKRTDYGIRNNGCIYEINDFRDHPWDLKIKDYPELARLPEQILLLNFNYTNTAEKYLNQDVATIVPIHGVLEKPESIIFGYGDEIDPVFKQLRDLNNGDCLKNVKSIRYLEAPNYRNVLSFIESAPFQVLIMGHSCGNSDRTLLNTIFEHKNCVSIKPYYYLKPDGTNNYFELVQNISRNFNDMKLMRDRVVNKTQCEPLVHN